MLDGRGAGGPPAASAVLGDLIVAARHRRSGASVPPPPRRDPVRLRPVEDLTSVFYVSIDVLDRPGVLASVAAVFGGHGVSIRSMEQLGLGEEARLVFITHMARGGAVTRTIEDLGRLDVVDRVSGVLRVIGPEDET
jgi:homoserine dehydrogenase